MPANEGLSVRYRALTTKALRLEFAPQVERVREFVELYLDTIQLTVQPYPPIPPPPNRYKRTYNLYASWHRTGSTTSTGIDRSLFVGNVNAPYAKFVHGIYQRTYHRAHGWKKLIEHIHRDEFTTGVRALYAQMRVI